MSYGDEDGTGLEQQVSRAPSKGLAPCHSGNSHLLVSSFSCLVWTWVPHRPLSIVAVGQQRTVLGDTFPLICEGNIEVQKQISRSRRLARGVCKLSSSVWSTVLVSHVCC
jgi:hypothetical protein